LPVTLEQDGALSRIRLEGAIDIGCAQVLLADATDLDVTAVELLWAARREARASTVGFAFEGQAPEPVSVALAEAGFERFAATGETN
jgi:hypothetical protein